MKRVFSIVLATMAATVIFLSASATVDTAEAKQCVWNKAGFVLKVAWYPKDTVFVRDEDKKKTYVSGNPLQVDTIPLLQGSCRNSNDNVAALSVVGSEIIRASIIAASFVTIVGGTAAVCLATVGTGCAPAAGVAATAIGGVLAAGQGFIPLTDDVFALARPTTSRYTDVWGTAFSPQYKDNSGGPVN